MAACSGIAGKSAAAGESARVTGASQSGRGKVGLGVVSMGARAIVGSGKDKGRSGREVRIAASKVRAGVSACVRVRMRLCVRAHADARVRVRVCARASASAHACTLTRGGIGAVVRAPGCRIV